MEEKMNKKNLVIIVVIILTIINISGVVYINKKSKDRSTNHTPKESNEDLMKDE